MPTRMDNTRLFYFFIFIEKPYMKFLLSSSDAPENCGFTRWVDPAPIDPPQEYIEHLQNRIFELEAEVSAAAQEEDNGISPQQMCTIPNCSCPCHKNQGPPSSPSLPPAPLAMEAYYGE